MIYISYDVFIYVCYFLLSDFFKKLKINIEHTNLVHSFFDDTHVHSDPQTLRLSDPQILQTSIHKIDKIQKKTQKR